MYRSSIHRPHTAARLNKIKQQRLHEFFSYKLKRTTQTSQDAPVPNDTSLMT